MAGPDSSTRGSWAWHPELPIGTAPVFAWPSQPVEVSKCLFGRGLLLSPIVIYFLLSAGTWLWLTPAQERWATLKAGWVARVFVVILGLVVGGQRRMKGGIGSGATGGRVLTGSSHRRWKPDRIGEATVGGDT